MTAYLHPYNHQWPKRYQSEAKAIKQVSTINLDLYHIGSTALPGLYAKDCIDMLGVIDSFQHGKEIINVLESLNYEYRGDYGIKGRHYFAKNLPHKFHLHIYVKGSAQIKKHLKYVEKMSKNLDLVLEFNQIKQDLAEKYPTDKNKYQQNKSFFYKKIGCDY